MSRSAHAKGKRRFHAKFAHARFIVIPYPVCNRYDLGMQIINICHGMCCPSLQWHRTGYRWANIAGGALVVWPGSYGPYSRTVVVIKLGAARRFADPSHTHNSDRRRGSESHTHDSDQLHGSESHTHTARVSRAGDDKRRARFWACGTWGGLAKALHARTHTAY